MGTLIGLNFNYAWAYYAWPEAHEYFVSAPAVFIWGVTTICDIIYGFVLYHIKKSERELSDGRKVAAEADTGRVGNWEKRKTQKK